MRVDGSRATATAWGASFDGCVTKYSLSLARLLGLREAPGIEFDLTVPDAAFLVDAEPMGTHLLANGLRLFMFRCGPDHVGLFTATSHALGDRALSASVDVGNWPVRVLSKQGIRLWPDQEPYHLPWVEREYYEPPQQLVRVSGGRLHVPVAAGYVYRLAKAPAFIFAPWDMPQDEFRDRLLGTKVV